MEYLYKIKQLYIQCEFKDYSEKQIRNLYKINPSHKILSGIWTGPILRKGFVITDNGEEIAEKLVSTSPRGVTLIDVEGAYTKENKKMLFCARKFNKGLAKRQKVW